MTGPASGCLRVTVSTAARAQTRPGAPQPGPGPSGNKLVRVSLVRDSVKLRHIRVIAAESVPGITGRQCPARRHSPSLAGPAVRRAFPGIILP